MADRTWLSDLRNGDAVDGVFLVARKDLRQSKVGSLYIDGEVTDRSGSMPIRMWDATERIFAGFEVQDFVKITGQVESYKDRLQLIVKKIAKADESKVNMDDFLPASEHDVDEMDQQLRKILRTVEDPHLIKLFGEFFNDEEFMAAFKQCPAAVAYHHAYLGGLLEHTLSLARLASRIAPDYPALRKDLLLAGVFFHDIGKTRELTWTRGFQYTDEGGLVGHLVIGAVMIEDKARAVDDFPAALLAALKHIVLSHHGEYQFGSPKLPATVEAIALHYIDNMDAKIHAFHKAIQESESRDPSSSWTEFNRMFERRLFKG